MAQASSHNRRCKEWVPRPSIVQHLSIWLSLISVYLKPVLPLILFVPLLLPFGAFSFYLAPSPFPSLCLSPPPPLFSSTNAPPPLSHVYCSRKSSTDTSMCVCAYKTDMQAKLIWSSANKEFKKKSLNVVKSSDQHWLLKDTSQPCKYTPLKH